MKRAMFLVVLLACAFASASAQSANSQAAVRPSSEQSLQELVTEVRQLRATLQRMNAAVYKGQVLLERLKLQQEQVSRIARELGQTREEVQELRAQHARIREVLKRVETDVEAGIKKPAEIADWKGELDVIGQRESRLSMRETQLANDLEAARAILNDLNDKLNVLMEIEMTPK